MEVVGLSFYRVVGGVVQNVLKSLGHQVEITEGFHSNIFLLLRGNLDLLVACLKNMSHWQQTLRNLLLIL